VGKIKENYQKELKKMSKSAIEKEIETFTIQFTYDTQRIEGSTLTLRETADLLEKGIAPKRKPIHDIKEAKAHRKIFFGNAQFKRRHFFALGFEMAQRTF
jgi:Fic family protein